MGKDQGEKRGKMENGGRKKGLRSEFQCSDGQDHNTNVRTEKARIPMFERIRLEFQCLER